eukprot:GHVU01087942.1.p2 GENE.GHVU01087942.1~~GHVU01087942.1.p2  ORF type:complete len:140 (-),score=8.38 GHVU01087942.1:42-461(-)
MDLSSAAQFSIFVSATVRACLCRRLCGRTCSSLWGRFLRLSRVPQGGCVCDSTPFTPADGCRLLGECERVSESDGCSMASCHVEAHALRADFCSAVDGLTTRVRRKSSDGGGGERGDAERLQEAQCLQEGSEPPNKARH